VGINRKRRENLNVATFGEERIASATRNKPAGSKKESVQVTKGAARGKERKRQKRQRKK